MLKSEGIKMKVTKKIGFIVLGFVFATVLMGCNGDSTDGDPDAEITEIRIAQLIDDANPNSGLVFEDFRAALEEYLEIPVVGISDTTHVVAIEAMRAGNLEIMWGSPFVYLLAQQALDVERIVVTDNPNSINKTVFITANDDIQTLADLEGHSFAFINPSSASGFLYPAYHLINEFDLTVDEILAGSFFSTVTNSGAQDASVMGVINGEFDAAAVGNLNLQSFLASGMVSEDDFRIIADTEVIPFPGYIASSELPQELIERIRNFMINYDNEDYFETRFNAADTRFVQPDIESINHLRSMVEVLEIDLEEQ